MNMGHSVKIIHISVSWVGHFAQLKHSLRKVEELHHCVMYCIYSELALIKISTVNPKQFSSRHMLKVMYSNYMLNHVSVRTGQKMDTRIIES